jgi:DNA-binding NarL/FixJ family response regulator
VASVTCLTVQLSKLSSKDKNGTGTINGVRLVIVDDDPVIRQILRTITEDLGAEVLAEADNGQTAIEEAERHHPELMLLDVSMPVMGGLPATRYLHEHLPELNIIMVSQYSRKVYAEEALESGAKGYVVKACVASELESAVKIVLEGGTFVSSRLQ